MRHRPLIAIPLAAALVLGGTLSAVAKEQEARASLEATLPRDATPGTTIDVGWSVFFVGTGQPFAAEGMFIELTGPNGSVTRAAGTTTEPDSGRYRATVEVPAGGIAKVAMGMDMGEPIYFQRVGLTFAGLPAEIPAAPAPDPANVTSPAAEPVATPTGPDLRAAGLAAIGIALVAALAVAGRRRAAAARPA